MCTSTIPPYSCRASFPSDGIPVYRYSTLDLDMLPVYRYSTLDPDMLRTRVPVQYNRPGHATRVPVQYTRPGDATRVSVQYTRPGHATRVPVQYDRPGHATRVPVQSDSTPTLPSTLDLCSLPAAAVASIFDVASEHGLGTVCSHLITFRCGPPEAANKSTL
jgi:hypothetical protein